ncbi:hypothetical protein K438DRAFT_1465317, partial [Mycena galopus ATCC 62051]
VAILGPGGMGKTALAVAALHDTKVVDKYPSRHFIACDAANADSLVTIIARSLGLEESGGSASHLIHHLSHGASHLILLDNFETPWEPEDGRARVEEFLSLLTSVQHVALLITMRGAERPHKVRWTHPFLPVLSPLTPEAAHKTFIEIADENHDAWEIEQLLQITDNIPIAVQLVGTQRTTMLSVGHDKRSNLEISIQLSLSSPRMLSSPGALDLLSLMSLLPDGISDLDLVHSKPPIPDILRCKTTLIRTSLAYVDHTGRFKVLFPIRDYLRAFRPP